MRVLFYSGGVAGSGHVVLGISLANAIRRAGAVIDFGVLSVETPFAFLAGKLGVPIRTVPAEDGIALGPDRCERSELYRAVMDFAPDVLVVDLSWFALDSFIRELPCRKVLLVRQVEPRFFSLRTRERDIVFRPGDYDRLVATEPGFDTPFPCERVEPIVIRDRGEIMDAAAARADLGLGVDERSCLFAFNGNEGEGATAWKSFSYLEDEGWSVLRSDNRSGGLFPVVDWYNAFDLVVCGAGYSAFWEARYLGKDAFFVPFPRRHENQARRVAQCLDYVPASNGADRVVDMIMGL
ncbi:MAG: hypothetical protein NT080_10325 [Spirochaetes bacterium]|nr:hypothetical protein [Spirochaetota bacterium]